MRPIAVFVKDRHQPLCLPPRADTALIRAGIFTKRRKRICTPEVRKMQAAGLRSLQHVAHRWIVGRISDEDEHVSAEKVVYKTGGPAGAQIGFTKIRAREHEV